VLTKKVWERTEKISHFKTASNSFQRKTWKGCGNAVPTCSRPTTPFLFGVLRILRLPVGKITFVGYSSSLRFSLICLTWDQYKLAQVLNSNLIKETKMEKTHLKIPNELYITESLYCSEEATMLLLYDNAASPTHSSYLLSNLKLWSGALQTQTATNSFAWFNRYEPVNTGRSQRALCMTTLQWACGLTNGQTELHESSLKDPCVINTEFD